jgi:hypothetical protein
VTDEKQSPIRLLDDVQHWRTRAKETREIAETTKSKEIRDALVTIATEYDRLAELAEQRANNKEQQEQECWIEKNLIPSLLRSSVSNLAFFVSTGQIKRIQKHLVVVAIGMQPIKIRHAVYTASPSSVIERTGKRPKASVMRR